ncbi:universal stress protein [Streptomyces sp. LP05-1]|uniref:Universal stress protein n=1 Tax=Streptomyces pyxinae TaxID=2970734 RepID=A0ABT2CG47_9ACTN|nr:universal stress protein [Streptomyces sp. LP05-1]MCS0636285.1 universal stress protein [Streptomyces sp. LP05-1]
MTAPPPERGRVVVGVSSSLAGLAALRRGALEARRDGRTLEAVLAWEPPEGGALYVKRPDSEWAAHWAREARQRLLGAFDEALGGLPTDLHLVCRVIRNAPGPALCAVAHRPDDLLVLGAAPPAGRLRARLHRRPVARYVLAHAGCPVLTVPGPRLLPGEARLLRRTTPPTDPDRHETAA